MDLDLKRNQQKVDASVWIVTCHSTESVNSGIHSHSGSPDRPPEPPPLELVTEDSSDGVDDGETRAVNCVPIDNNGNLAIGKQAVAISNSAAMIQSIPGQITETTGKGMHNSADGTGGLEPDEGSGVASCEDAVKQGPVARSSESIGSQLGLKRRREQSVELLAERPVPKVGPLDSRGDGLTLADSSSKATGAEVQWWTQCGTGMHRGAPAAELKDVECIVITGDAATELGNSDITDAWPKVDLKSLARDGETIAPLTKDSQECADLEVGNGADVLSVDLGNLCGGDIHGAHLSGLHVLDDDLGDRGWWEAAIGGDREGGKIDSDSADEHRLLHGADGEAYVPAGPAVLADVHGSKRLYAGLLGGQAEQLAVRMMSSHTTDSNGTVSWKHEALPAWQADESLACDRSGVQANGQMVIPELPAANEGQSLAEWDGQRQSVENGEGGDGWWQNRESDGLKWYAGGASGGLSGGAMARRRSEVPSTFVPVTSSLSSDWSRPSEVDLRLDAWEGAQRGSGLDESAAGLPGRLDHYAPGQHLAPVSEEGVFDEDALEKDDDLNLVMEILDGEERALGLNAAPLGLNGWESLGEDDNLMSGGPYMQRSAAGQRGAGLGAESRPVAGGQVGTEHTFGRGLVVRPGRIHVTSFAQPVSGTGIWRNPGSPAPRRPGERARRMGRRSLARARSAELRSASPRGERRPQTLPKSRSESSKDVTPTRRSHRLSIKRAGGGVSLLRDDGPYRSPSPAEKLPTVPVQARSSSMQRSSSRGVKAELQGQGKLAVGHSKEASFKENSAVNSRADVVVVGLTEAKEKAETGVDWMNSKKCTQVASIEPLAHPVTDRHITDSGFKVSEEAGAPVLDDRVVDDLRTRADEDHAEENSREVDAHSKHVAGADTRQVSQHEEPVLAPDAGAQIRAENQDQQQEPVGALWEGHVKATTCELVLPAVKEDDGEDPWSLEIEESARTRGITAWEGAGRRRKVEAFQTSAEMVKSAEGAKGQVDTPASEGPRPVGLCFAPGWGGRVPVRRPVRESSPEKKETGVTVTFVYAPLEESESEEEDDPYATEDIGEAAGEESPVLPVQAFSPDVLDQCVSLAALEMVGVGEVALPAQPAQPALPAQPAHPPVPSPSIQGSPELQAAAVANGRATGGMLQRSEGHSREGRAKARKASAVAREAKLKEVHERAAKVVLLPSSPPADSSPVLAVKSSSRNRRPPRRLVEDGVDSSAYLGSAGQRKGTKEDVASGQDEDGRQMSLASLSSPSLGSLASQCTPASLDGQPGGATSALGQSGITRTTVPLAREIIEQPVVVVYERRSASKVPDTRATVLKTDAVAGDHASAGEGSAGRKDPVPAGADDGEPTVPQLAEVEMPPAAAEADLKLGPPPDAPPVPLPRATQGVVSASALEDSPAMTVRSRGRERKRPQRFSDDESEGWWSGAAPGSERRTTGSKSTIERRHAGGVAAEQGLLSVRTESPVPSTEMAPVIFADSFVGNGTYGGTMPAGVPLDVVIALPVQKKKHREMRLSSLSVLPKVGQVASTSDLGQMNGSKRLRKSTSGDDGGEFGVGVEMFEIDTGRLRRDFLQVSQSEGSGAGAHSETKENNVLRLEDGS